MDSPIVGYVFTGYASDGDRNYRNAYRAIEVTELFELLDSRHVRVEPSHEGANTWAGVDDDTDYKWGEFATAELAAIDAGIFYGLIIRPEAYAALPPEPYTFKVRKDSWHFRIAHVYESNVQYCDNLCQYVRFVIYGSLLLTFLFTIAGAYAYSMVSGLVWLVVMAVTGTLFDMPIAACMLPVTVFLALVLAIAVLVEHLKDKKRERLQARIAQGYVPPVPEPGFVRKAYTNFKEKTCVRIKVIK